MPSVAAGFYFANPRNRFWPALNASRLLPEPIEPGPQAMDALFKYRAMGFTDLVKRPTRGCAELRAADYRVGAMRLLALLERYQPQCAWFHGKVAFKQFVRHTGGHGGGDDWGLQRLHIGSTQCFVTPNSSPANAAFSLADLVGWYNLLADHLGMPG